MYDLGSALYSMGPGSTKWGPKQAWPPKPGFSPTCLSGLMISTLSFHSVLSYVVILGFPKGSQISPLSSCALPETPFFFFFFFQPRPWDMEVLGLGVKSELQLLAYTTAMATPRPSQICDLHHSSRQR